MATGYTFPVATLLPITGLVGDHVLPLGDWAVIDGATATGGIFAELRPVVGRSADIDGSRAATFFDDFYNRVHLIPAAVDFGTVAGSIARPVTLWNARLGSVTLNSIVESDITQGVTLSGPSVPAGLSSLATRSYTVTAAADGNSIIGLNIVFAFDNGEQPVLPVIGIRSKLWPFAPNWRERYSVAYEFKTDIFTSRSGKEQRRAQRTTPRRNIQFTLTRDRDDMRKVTRFLTKWQASDIVVPDLTRSALSPAGMPLNGTQIEVEDAPDWLLAGRNVALWDGVQYAARSVLSVVGTIVTFTSGSAEVWAGGTTLHPGVTGALSNDTGAKWLTDEVFEIEIDFAAKPGVDLPSPTGSPIDAFNGRELLPFAPNWQQGISGSFVQPTDVVDFGRGRTQTFTPVKFSTRLQQVNFVFGSQAESDEMVKFFSRMQGQRGEFYLPSGANDLVLKDAVPYAVTILKVAGLEVFDTYADDTVHRALMISTELGDFPRRVLTIASSGEDTIIELAIGLPFELTPESVNRISWLTATRFAVDLLTIESMTSGAGTVQMSTRTLEDLPVDEPVWGDLDAGAAWMIDFYGRTLTESFANPLHQWVHVEYPEYAGV